MTEPSLASPERTIAYMMSRFPVTTETFILYEILELERRGWKVEVFPLLPRRAAVAHPGAEDVVQRAVDNPYFSWSLFTAQLYWVFRKPRAYFGAWWEALKGNRGSLGFLVRALIVVPRAALFARQMEARGVSQVHAHWATHPTLAALVIKRLTEIPYSFTAHAHDVYVDRSMLKEKLDDAEFVATISGYNRDLLSELYGPEATEKISVVRCGVDFSVFSPPSRRPRITEKAPFTFVCVGSLQDYKGQRFLLDACAQLKTEGKEFRCLLVGEGPERPKLTAQVEALGLQQQVELLGQLPRNRVRETLNGAHAMVMPSIVTDYGKKEGIPVALMEALATELPVVATRISGIPELVEDGTTGLLVPQQDAKSLAAAMARMMKSEALRNRLASAGRVRVLSEFNLADNVSKLEGLLRTVGGEAPPQQNVLPLRASRGGARA